MTSLEALAFTPGDTLRGGGGGGSGRGGSGPAAATGRRARGTWPLTMLIGGFPIWWALGLSEILVFVLAVPMALLLVQRRRIVVPRGFGLWLIFLFWMLAGLPLLFADAPGAIPGGGTARLPIFIYRAAWYASCTIVLLWVGNLDEQALPARRVVRLLGWLFVVTTGGGLLGVVAPHAEFTSLFQALLPSGVGNSEFVAAIAHPQAASIQQVLGASDARPTAPFAYANTWGSVMALTLPFFLLGWLARDAGWRRWVAPFVLVLATAPIVLSLNRGLWICLALGAVILALQLAYAGRSTALLVLGVLLVVLAVAVLASPLGTTLTERLHNGKSNDRRGELLVTTVKDTLIGSPVAGYASTRRVQGSFDSIAGGDTPQCKACGVPPLGTQGQIWLVIFSQGIGGLVFFLGFFLRQFAGYWRSATQLQAAGTIVLVFFAVQMFIYDTLGWPLYVIMIAIALMWRERWRAAS